MSHSSPTVLLVDDQPALLKLMSRLLAVEGYHVLEASNAMEALAASRTHDQSLDLVVTDVAMPGMDGFALGEILEALRPATPVLYVTGNGSVIESFRQRRVAAHWSFLIKPFTPDAFLA